MQKSQTMDGNHAAAYASYALSEVAAIYPITPSSPMAESADEWSVRGKKNLFGSAVNVVEMQSEAGAAAAMHGSLQAGALTVTYTASQGLLLMIPNLYKMVGELLPGVLHVSARAIATHALSIFGDHQDVMACRQTGAAMLASSSVQQALDLGFIAHLAAIEARVPFIHFFDGFRTSHEYQKIQVPDYDDIAPLVNWAKVEEFRRRALNPSHPVARGTAQNPDIYFQGREVQNPFFDNVPGIVEKIMADYGSRTGRTYRPFVYSGAPDAQSVIIAMGSVCDTIDQVVDALNAKGEKVGTIHVHLYRPFSASHLASALPETAKRIAVLDRTKEPGAPGEPLYLDVVKALQERRDTYVVGGRYGLGSKDTRPSHILSVFRNLQQPAPRDGFTIGIEDDVTFHSLPESPIDLNDEAIACKFWGLGSDGTVGANKAAAGIIGENTDLYVQAYFSYDSKKSGGTTVSHLRFGPKPIRAPYLISQADYIACHNKSFLHNYDVLKGIKNGGIFVLNCDWPNEELDRRLPGALKRDLAQKSVRFYTIDAVSIAQSLGLGNRINMVMQTAFFALTNVIPKDEAARLLKESNQKMYGKKGQEIVDQNNAAVDQGMQMIRPVPLPAKWMDAQEERAEDPPEVPDFVRRIQHPMARHMGDDLPVSAFVGMEDGTHPLGTTSYEKRGIAVHLPEWILERCIQCGTCSYVCPHATIRLAYLDEAESARAPQSFQSKHATGKGFEGYRLRVQVSPLDCTGCGNCADVCPAKGKALIMRPADEISEHENWQYATTLRDKPNLMPAATMKGSQLRRPLLEFNGACPGCGETPYIKLLTQLYGERMMIANATGCSSIWGASSPSIAYSTTAEGRGPAWANSLFEDNAEYGFGMYLGARQMRNMLAEDCTQLLSEAALDESLRAALQSWLEAMDDGARTLETSQALAALLKQHAQEHPLIAKMDGLSDYLSKRSFWIIGGDGWAYDIGYGGVDHVLSTGADVNLFVMDTEVYSNTGGQASKATPAGAVAKFATAGKQSAKKNLGMMAMSYGNVYVAQIAMGANPNQTINAITQAEAYPGPSLIIAYSPCVSHGSKAGMGSSMMQEKRAVEAGYWHLYRYNPALTAEGKNPFTLDSKKPEKSYQTYVLSELRYAQLMQSSPDRAKQFFADAELRATQQYETYRKMAEMTN